MRHLRPVISLIWVLAILTLPALNATAQTGATTAANSSTSASANSRAANAQIKAEAQAKTDAQAKADAAKKAASETKSNAQAKADAAKSAASQTKADTQAKADAQSKTASEAKAGIEANATSQTDVKLDKPSWQAVLDRLFGTPNNGLLDGQKAFQLRAENLRLTADQSAAFFSSSSASSQDLAALIHAAQALHGQVRMEGTIEGKPFELKLAGSELKVEGLTLTAAQRDSLVTELRGISGLHEAKIEALVDGRASVINMAGGRERIELLGRDRDDSARGDGKKVELPAKIEIDHKADIEHRIEHPAGADLHDRVESSGRVGGAIEKPELPRIGK